jgi:hypothetical protein
MEAVPAEDSNASCRRANVSALTTRLNPRLNVPSCERVPRNHSRDVDRLIHTRACPTDVDRLAVKGLRVGR